MRKFTIRRRFSEFLELQRELQRECQVQSGILEAGVAHKVLLGNRTARGSALAYFLNSVTNSMAERGLFSPRLMEWLGIDTIRVHAEEESCVAKLLDKPTCGPPWQIVDEAWLKLWRTFVMGGGLRIPPGKVDSSDLLQFVAGGQLKGGLRDPSVKWLRWGMPAVALDSSGKLSIKGRYLPKLALEIARDYRALSCNFFNYLLIVYGGDRMPSRKEQSFYSEIQFTKLGAIVVIQTLLRRRIARKRFNDLSAGSFSENCSEDSRRLMYEEKKAHSEADATATASADWSLRRAAFLEEAATWTQNSWRQKQAITGVGMETLRAVKDAQEVHARVSDGVETAFGDSPLVVEDLRDVLTMPEFPDCIEDMLVHDVKELRFRMHPSTGRTLVVANHGLGDYFPPLIPSEVLDLNGTPMRPFSHLKVLEHIRAAPTPIKVRLSHLRMNPGDPVELAMQNIDDPSVRGQAFKGLLCRGCNFTLHQGKCEINSCIWLTPTHLLWKRASKVCPGHQEMEKFLKVSGPWKTKKIGKKMRSAQLKSPTDLVDGRRYGNKRDHFVFFTTLGIEEEDFESLYKAAALWVANGVVNELCGTLAVSLYDLVGVRPGRSMASSGSRAFSKTSIDDSCFTLQFKRPSMVVRTGDRIGGKKPGLVVEVSHSSVQVVRRDETEVTMSKVRALKLLEHKDASATLHFSVIMSRSEKREVALLEDGSSGTKALRDAVVSGFQQVLKEVESSRYGVSSNGTPIRRTEPQRELRVI